MIDRSPPRLVRTKGAVAFLHPCQGCGKLGAPFGSGVNLRKERLGTWWCGPNGCRADSAKAEAPTTGAQAVLF